MLVSGGTRVALKTNPPSPVAEPPCPAEQTDDCDPSAAADELQQQEAELHPEGRHWFDLNDSAVTSIRESDIEKQFQGKESAYMLFYRKSQLLRPSDGADPRLCLGWGDMCGISSNRLVLFFFVTALSSPHYKVPSHLIQMAEEENIRLKQKRYPDTPPPRAFFPSFPPRWLCRASVSLPMSDDGSDPAVALSVRSVKPVTTAWSCVCTWRPATG